MPLNENGIAIRDFSPHHKYFTAEEIEPDILASSAQKRDEEDERWSAMTDQLIHWGYEESDFEVEGLVAPSHIAISRAGKFISMMRNNDWSLPTGIIADGEGGIVLENKQDPFYERIEIDELGSMKLVTFQDCKLIEEQVIDFE